jgi:Asp-tRNAAsn/Glu-tRNAGln amidotransferase C subunit
MVTHDEVRKIAALAKLYIAEDQLDAITGELNGIIAFADTVSAADASGYGADLSGNEAFSLRADVVSDSYESELILSNAMESGDGFFVVRNRG